MLIKKSFVIAIDGPAASGKGTLARRLAVHYGLAYLDTGKLYRAVAFSVLSAGNSPQDTQAAVGAANTLPVELLGNPSLSEERVGQAASMVAAIPEVRLALVDFQRKFANGPEGAVIDGRDIGTVICPHAEIKLFIYADVHSRAKRRYDELQGKGMPAIYEVVLKDLQERDERDSNRSAAPLKAAEDALLVDTSAMDAEQVFQYVIGQIEILLKR